MSVIATNGRLAKEIIKALGLSDIQHLTKVTINLDWSRGPDAVSVDIRKLLTIEEAEELTIVLNNNKNK
jgi:hypothetical protein